LEAGKTKIEYNGVEIGAVTAIRLSDDHRNAIATAQMVSHTESFLLADTKFWVVRPRISGATITGLGTLLSGAYIGLEIGQSKEQKRDFVALETQPVVTGEVPGRLFVLKTAELGSLDYGTPVFFRRLQVGEVASYGLDADGKALTVKVFVRAPYDQYVNSETRFWQASGIDVSLTASGLKVQTQSLLSILIGGIAFETAATGPVMPPSEANAVFTLFTTRAQAFLPAAQNPETYVLNFNESVRGLAPGSPVEFRGIPIGVVSDVRAQIDVKTSRFSTPVTIRLDPRRLGVNVLDLKPGETLANVRENLINIMISRGVRAQLRTGSLLTGAMYVAFDVVPGAPPARVNWSQTPVELPTVPGQLEASEAKLESIINKLNEMPLDEIGRNVDKSLGDLDLTLASARGALITANGTLTSARGTFVNTSDLTGPNSVEIQQLNNTLQEVSRAARAIRVLADYLEQHPEALLRGKKGEPQ
jgi:paraquat-inducible protein B